MELAEIVAWFVTLPLAAGFLLLLAAGWVRDRDSKRQSEQEQKQELRKTMCGCGHPVDVHKLIMHRGELRRAECQFASEGEPEFWNDCACTHFHPWTDAS